MGSGRHRGGSVIVGSLVALAACRGGDAATCPPSPYRHAKMLVIAHAGGEGLGPANTLAAMRASRAAGADANDADVHITSDGELVAIHDDTVDATTNGSGRVAAMPLRELKTLDAGWHFAGDGGDFPYRGRGVTIPTIAEVLAESGDMLTSLELKDDGGAAPAVLCALLRGLARTGSVYVSSDTDPPLEEFKARCPEVTTTVTDALVPVMSAARTAGTAWCSPVPIGQPPYRADRRPTRASLAWSHDHGLANFTWTVDDPDTLRYLAGIGMDGVYTTRPDIARAIVDEVAGAR